ncbi:MAG: hypothetical protein PW790_09235 [Parvibaculaceae bacterium]|nr:hypothetical protein [Parvibaculaceae bacterium]
MTTAREIVKPLIETALAEAAANKIPADNIARILFEQVLRIWREVRDPADVRSELIAAADHLDPDEDFMFMRP